MNNLAQKITTVFNDSIRHMLDDISEHYKISKDELYLKYLDTNNKINNNLCMAKKQDLLQCTRKKKSGFEFCGKHNKNQKFGRIDDKMKEESSDYIVTNKETFGQGEFYVDKDNIVYDIINDVPQIIGKKTSDNKLVLL